MTSEMTCTEGSEIRRLHLQCEASFVSCHRSQYSDGHGASLFAQLTLATAEATNW